MSDTIILAAILIPCLIVAIVFHEVSHGWSALMLGDPTAKRVGRLSLNPLAHLDPLGTAMIVFAGFGWGKPVPVNAWALGRNVFRGMAMVASAGPISNLFTAVLLAMPFHGNNLDALQLLRSSGFAGTVAIVTQYAADLRQARTLGASTGFQLYDGAGTELADRMDVPLGTMKSWIRRGLAKLKACMEAGE